jgi:glutathione S-transferase
MMINLCGIGISNYYNKIKLVMLEKNIDFTEEHVMPSQNEALLQRSPLGKIPFIETEHGNLSESQVILEYLEEIFPQIPLYPADSYERAKCRELIQHLELNIELHARRLYKEALFGGTVSDETKAEVKDRLEIGLTGLTRLATFSPYIAGDNYSATDIVAWLHFFMVSMVSQKIYGVDMLAAHFPDVARYMQLLETRPAVQKVAAERGAAISAFFSK